MFFFPVKNSLCAFPNLNSTLKANFNTATSVTCDETTKNSDIASQDAENLPEEDLNFYPKSIFEKIDENPHELKAHLMHHSPTQAQQISLSPDEFAIANRLGILLSSAAKISEEAAIFTPAEWVQILTHKSHLTNNVPANTKLADLGEHFYKYLLSVRFLGTSTTSTASQSVIALSVFSQLASVSHAATCARRIGMHRVCRHDPRTSITALQMQSVLFAAVGGVLHKRGMEAATRFVERHLQLRGRLSDAGPIPSHKPA